MAVMAQYNGLEGSEKNKVCVAVRFRPLRCPGGRRAPSRHAVPPTAQGARQPALAQRRASMCRTRLSRQQSQTKCW